MKKEKENDRKEAIMLGEPSELELSTITLRLTSWGHYRIKDNDREMK